MTAAKPSRTGTRLSMAACIVVAVAAVALLVLADNGLRIAMTLVLISAALGIALAVYQARRTR